MAGAAFPRSLEQRLRAVEDDDEAMRAVRGRAPGDPYPPPDEPRRRAAKKR